MMMLVVLVSAGWSWLLCPCVVGVGAGGAGVAAGGDAGGAPPPHLSDKGAAGYCMNLCAYVYRILPSAKLPQS